MNISTRRGFAGPLPFYRNRSTTRDVGFLPVEVKKRSWKSLYVLAVLAIALGGISRARAQDKFTAGDVYGFVFASGSQMERVPAAGEGGTTTSNLVTLPGRVFGQIAWSPDRQFAYVGDYDNGKVVKVSASGVVSDFAEIPFPYGVVVLPDGRVICASPTRGIRDITNGGSGPFPDYVYADSPTHLLRTSDGRILTTQAEYVVDATNDQWSIFASLPAFILDWVQLSDGRILCSLSDGRVMDITSGSAALFAWGRTFSGLAQDGAGRVLAYSPAAAGIWDISNGGDFSGVQALYTTPAGSGGSVLGSVPVEPWYELLYATKDAVPKAGEDVRIQADAVWTNLGIPAVSESGKVAFLGKWKAPRGGELRSQTGAGIFLNDDLIVKAGDPVPGLSGAVFRSFRAPVVGAGGRVAFIATIKGEEVSTATDTVVVSAGRTGSLEVIAREGDEAPGSDGARFRAFSSVSIQGDEVGGTIFQATLLRGSGSPVVDFTNNSGVWWQPAGEEGVQLLVREGGLGFSAGEAIKTFRVLRTSGGSAGQGRGQIDGASALIQVGLSTGRQAQVLVTPEGFTPVAITGDILGGAALPEAEWLRMGLPSSGAAGTYISVLGALKNNVGGVVSANAKGIFASDNGGDTWEPVAQTGTAAPGFESATFRAFKDPVNSATGAGVAFIGSVRGESVTPLANTGIWWRPAGGALSLVAGQGIQPPGAPQGAKWKGFKSLALPGGASGPLFTAALQRGEGGITTIDDMALYSANSTGTVSELLRENQEIALLERTVKKFHVLRAVSGSAGTTRAFNSKGEVVLQVTFKDRKIGILKIEQ